MWLVLCDPEDHAALWVYRGLRRLGLAPLEVLSPQELWSATRSVHRLDRAGATFTIELADGRTLVSGDIAGVLNRWSSLPAERFAFATDADARYASEEFEALALSWLACLGPAAINRPNARGLAGAWRAPAEWAVLATRAGLPVGTVTLSTRRLAAAPESPGPTRQVVVLDRQVFGAELPSDVAASCARLARAAECDLLGITFHVEESGQLRFGTATPLPDLRIGQAELLSRLHGRLVGLGTTTS